jgi:hypothetical protein
VFYPPQTTIQLRATAYDSFGQAITSNVTFNWSSDTPNTATVDSTGLVTTHSGGVTQIRATEQNSGKTGAAIVYVVYNLTGTWTGTVQEQVYTGPSTGYQVLSVPITVTISGQSFYGPGYTTVNGQYTVGPYPVAVGPYSAGQVVTSQVTNQIFSFQGALDTGSNTIRLRLVFDSSTAAHGSYYDDNLKPYAPFNYPFSVLSLTKQ